MHVHLWVCMCVCVCVCFEVVLCMWLHRGLIIIIMINVTFCLSRSSGDHISCLPPINCQESGQSGHYAILLNRFVAYMTWSKLKRLDNDQTFTVDPFKRFLFKKNRLIVGEKKSSYQLWWPEEWSRLGMTGARSLYAHKDTLKERVRWW